ncbi:MAG: transglutaminase N-terminal domain-containing protein [Hyphomicrobiaceae bacterium]
MLISIEHTTRYRYEGEASYSVQSLRLTPSDFDGQRVHAWRIESRPASELTPLVDGFGNIMHLMTCTRPHSEIEIVAAGVVEVEDRHGVVGGLAVDIPLRIYQKSTSLTQANAAILELGAQSTEKERIPWLHDLMHAIHARVRYLTGVTSAETTAAEALAAGQGVCQDHAHIFISAARAAGIPARYVTGYLLTGDGSAEPAHHAWAEAWVEGLGWLGFDVANVICPTDHYVRLAAALDARYAAPIRGSRRGGAGESLEVAVKVAQDSAQQ